MLDCLAGKSVALAHHWLLSMRGGEKVLQAMADLVPDAPIFTFLAQPDELSDALRRRDIRPSLLAALPWLRHNHRYALPLFPLAARSLDCRDFDVVICSDAALAKGVRCRRDALKLCYCHSPMRYVWSIGDDYRRQMSRANATALRLAGPYIRSADRRAARTVTAFAANSRHVQERIRRAYGRASAVIYPPVETPVVPGPRVQEDYYLVVSELVEYKRPDLAVDACNAAGRRLIVAGDGPMASRLRRAAGPTVQIAGRLDDAAIARLMASCRALLFCGEEDFGLVPVEVQLHGRPVIALGRGGATETVVDGCTGVFFAEPTVDAVVAAMRRFEADAATRFDADAIRDHARRFSRGAFERRFSHWVTALVRAWEAGGPAAARELAEHRPESLLPPDDDASPAALASDGGQR